MIHNRSILITGIGGPAGRSAVTYFKAKAFPVTGTEVRGMKSPVDSFNVIPPAGDISFPEILMDIIRRERPSLLIPTLTEELPVISRMKRDIEGEGCTVFISSPVAVDIVNDKLKTFMIMAGHGITVPNFCDEFTPDEIIVSKLGFPLLYCPRFGRGGRDITIYRTYEDMFDKNKKGMVFQEYIPGTEFDLNMFIDRGGGIISSVVLEKTVFKKGDMGNAISVERVERNDVVKLGIKVAGILNLEGPIAMDIRLRTDGTPVLLGINASPGRNVLFAWEILDGLLDAWKRSLLTGVYR
jgi:carbamoyl-phosphate synthase large subunit